MIKPDKLRFGTAGIPWCAKDGDTINGIAQVRILQLDAMELEFVRNVNITPEKAPLVKAVAEKSDVLLSAHASYFINLNAQEKEKLKASINRILQAAKIAYLCGGWSVCFHSAYYLGVPHDKVYDQVKEILEHIVKTLKENDVHIWIRPETGGKLSQFADSYDLIKMASEVEGVMPCFDIAHQYARSNGKWNTKEDFQNLFTEVEKVLGKEGLHNVHMHTEGIAFTEKGEKNHLNLAECKLNYYDLVRVWKEFKLKGVVISESPNIEDDALLLQKTYQKH